MQIHSRLGHFHQIVPDLNASWRCMFIHATPTTTFHDSHPPTPPPAIIKKLITTLHNISLLMQLGEALAERGHELHTVANEDCKGLKKLTKIGVINHGFKLDKGCIEEDEELKKVQMSMVMSGFSLRNVASLMWNLSSTLRNLITAMLSDAVVTELRKENFDIAIVDAIVFSRYL